VDRAAVDLHPHGVVAADAQRVRALGGRLEERVEQGGAGGRLGVQGADVQPALRLGLHRQPHAAQGEEARVRRKVGPQVGLVELRALQGAADDPVADEPARPAGRARRRRGKREQHRRHTAGQVAQAISHAALFPRGWEASG
jgi:hypothetical protein